MTARVLAFERPPRTEPAASPRVKIAAVAVSAVESREWPGDERAVTRFLAGDVVGFEQIVRHYSAPLFSLAARLVGTVEAEDVVQETFLRAYRGLENFRGESSLKTWLYAIALNRARARHGTLARFKALFSTRSARDEVTDVLDDAADPAASPEDATVAREQRARLRAAIRELPEEFRTAVILRDLEGLSYQEVAAVLSVPIGTVRSRIARGRSLLKEALS
jgi:RNA polymerase sigma-70 factor (ECF subfamily)